MTHAQPLIGVSTGAYAEALGDTITLETKTFNAGPSAIEALFAGEIDATYIGPNPAIIGYVQSGGEALRIVAGSASAGARFIVRPDANITTAADLDGKTIATPQLRQHAGRGTARVSAGECLDSTENGGTVKVQPTANADTLTLFQRGDIAGAWVPNRGRAALRSRLVASSFLDERDLWPDGDFVTTHLIVATEFLEERPDIVKALLEGHVKAIDFLNSKPEEAQEIVATTMADITRAELPAGTLESAWPALTFTTDPVAASLTASAERAEALGLLKPVDLDGIDELELLNEGPVRGRQTDHRRPVTDTALPADAPTPTRTRPDPGSAGAAIVLENVHKSYGPAGNHVLALTDVSLDVQRGSFVCLVGASGCGKSTLLNMVAGLDRPGRGQVRVQGRVALLFQDAALFPWLTASENIELALRLAGVPGRQRPGRARELLHLVHLDGFGDKRPHQLSGGMRQRTALGAGARPGAPTSCSWTSRSDPSTR